jgi:hypothetical protein
MAYLAFMQLESPLPHTRELQLSPILGYLNPVHSQEANCNLLERTVWYGKCVPTFRRSYSLHLQGKMQTVCSSTTSHGVITKMTIILTLNLVLHLDLQFNPLDVVHKRRQS